MPSEKVWNAQSKFCSQAPSTSKAKSMKMQGCESRIWPRVSKSGHLSENVSKYIYSPPSPQRHTVCSYLEPELYLCRPSCVCIRGFTVMDEGEVSAPKSLQSKAPILNLICVGAGICLVEQVLVLAPTQSAHLKNGWGWTLKWCDWMVRHSMRNVSSRLLTNCIVNCLTTTLWSSV